MFSFLKKSSPATDPAAIVRGVAEGRMILVDVRDPAELRASGKAAGAIAIPLALLPAKADPRHPDHDARLKADMPMVVYCAAGARAGNAKALLERLGYADVTNLGGLGDWQRAGGAVVPA